MIRDSDTIYKNCAKTGRLQKEYDSDYQKEVKRELNATRDALIFAKRNGQESKIVALEKDLSYWKNEMSAFDNNVSHKKLKLSVKKYSYENLYNKVKEYIVKKAESNEYSISKEDVAANIRCRVKDLDKIFMQLNREGILSQAEHRFMHDSMRNPNEETISSDYGRYSDWASDIYRICDTKLISRPEEDMELE